MAVSQNSPRDVDDLVRSDDPNHPANLIPSLCAQFYTLGWVTGTGGGISIRDGDKVFLAPSGVQKEKILPEHIFVLPYPQPTIPRPGSKRVFLREPTTAGLKESACCPLFFSAFRLREAGACIHTHSQHAVMVTLLFPGNEFKISHQEMIKGVRIGGMGKTLSFLDTLTIPIIENTPDEEDLTDSMAEAMERYPDAPAILVRRHGLYVWGPTWDKAKTQAECLDYLFEMAVKMKLAGMDTMAPQTDGKIDGHSIANLIILLVVNIFVVYPLRIPIPRLYTRCVCWVSSVLRISDGICDLHKPRRATFGLVSAPLIGVLVLLASKSIDGGTVKKGIVGDPDGLKPYDIMLLFICLAYIAISLDATGLLRYLAFKISQKGGPSGRKLYAGFFGFFFIFASLMGNDAIILSGTGFLVYFTKVNGVDPKAWVFSQFAVANIASATLVSSNITNLVITSSFGISFLTYSAWVILPTVATAIAAYMFLSLFQYRKDIPERIEEIDVNARKALVDPWGAIIGSCIFLAALIALLGGSAAGILGGVWEVTVPAALLMLTRDIWHDIRHASIVKPSEARQTPSVPADDDAIEMEVAEPTGDVANPSFKSSSTTCRTAKPVLRHQSSSRLPTTQSTIVPPLGLSTGSVSRPQPPVTLSSLGKRLSRRFPTVTYIAQRLPFPLLPFSFCMFILVDGVTSSGWGRVFSTWYQAWAIRTGTTGCVFGMSVLAVVLCNIIGTNIGCCILLSSILETWSSIYNPPQRHLTASIYSLALASNIGAVSFTFPASLAGLLWKDLLSQKGIKIGAREFLKQNWKVLIVSGLVGCGVLIAEVLIML
ncbi:Class II aldolase/adducin N-terminal domain protein [Phaffia rhodozyma]|uniref:Methylthioribulose-1-phosphate dehydratase n=1 Tax=Phaffia rhodozyma TaxID=264483 RepID=A0A0F7SL87_PHARH|nr:Class II aldolase/adducin N-terminal domain protein [Phaffia rhodozyma]